jgi:hypothetical protein
MNDDPTVPLKEEMAHLAKGYEATTQRLLNEIARLQSDKSQLQIENSGLKAEISRLQSENLALKASFPSDRKD